LDNGKQIHHSADDLWYRQKWCSSHFNHCFSKWSYCQTKLSMGRKH